MTESGGSIAPPATAVDPGEAEPEGSWPAVDRRRGEDRRSRPTRFWDSLLGRRQRVSGRRAGENQDTYVDRYEARDVWLVLGVFLLNVLDALCTMVWLSRGGSEGNPIMELALEAGDAVFLFQKCFLAGGWLLLLLVHKNFRIARVGLWVLFVIYGALALYHGFLAAFAEPLRS